MVVARNPVGPGCAMMAGAAVAITKSGTDQSRATAADRTGGCKFPAVVPGTRPLKFIQRKFAVYRPRRGSGFSGDLNA